MKYLVILVIIILFNPALAQWEKCNNGMEDLTAYRLAQKDGRLMVGTLSGFIYFSSDNAKNWTARNLGLHNYKFALLTSSAGYLYFATSDHFAGVFRSSDGGNRWRWYLSPGPFPDVYPFLSISTNDSLVLAGTLSKGVWIRRNDQQKTERYYGEANGLPKSPIYATAISGDTLYAGSWGKGLYRSIDTGNTWENKSEGLASLHIHSLLVRENLILAGTARGIFRSSDYGETWTDVSNSKIRLPVLVLEFLGDFILAGTSESGIHLSEDGGKTWSSRNFTISNQRIYSIDVVGDKVFVGTCGGGVLFSSDSCKSWEPRNIGLPNLYVGSVIHNHNRVIVGLLNDLIYVSDDLGKTWQRKQVWIDGPCGMKISSLYFDSNLIYAGTEGTGIYRSTDNGRHWEAKSVGLENYSVTSIIKHHNMLYAGTEGKGIYLSANNGDNWILNDTALFTKGIYDLAINDKRLYVATQNKIYSTDNNSESWAERFKGRFDEKIIDIELSGNSIIVGTEYIFGKGRVILSTDDGQSWEQKFDSIYFETIETDKNICFVGHMEGLKMSTNYGIDWFNVPGLMPTIQDMVILGDEVIATSSWHWEGCWGEGVFKAKLSDLYATAVTDIPNVGSFSLSPNPASDYIEIRFPDGYETGLDNNIRIYDVLGNCVSEVGNINEQPLHIDIANLSGGVYFVRIGERCLPFIKN